MRNIPSFLSLSAVTIVRFYAMYRPLRVFTTTGGVLVAGGILLSTCFLYAYFAGGSPAGHVQSLILAVALVIIGLQTCLIGLLADLVQMNRRISEETMYRLRRSELERAASKKPGR